MDSAPAGSRIERVSSKASLIAAQIASVSTSTISSTSSRQMRNGSLPTCLTATPSAKSPTLSSFTRRPASSERAIAAESTGSTPMIRISGRKRHPLSMIPGGGSYDPTRAFPGGQVRHPVVRAAQLEREHRLLILALQQHRIAEPHRQRRGDLERRFDCDVVNLGRQDLLEIV